MRSCEYSSRHCACHVMSGLSLCTSVPGLWLLNYGDPPKPRFLASLPPAPPRPAVSSHSSCNGRRHAPPTSFGIYIAMSASLLRIATAEVLIPYASALRLAIFDKVDFSPIRHLFTSSTQFLIILSFCGNPFEITFFENLYYFHGDYNRELFRVILIKTNIRIVEWFLIYFGDNYE